MNIEEAKVKGLAFALDKVFNAAPLCDKHFIPKDHTWWGGWICPKCEQEEAEKEK